MKVNNFFMNSLLTFIDLKHIIKTIQNGSGAPTLTHCVFRNCDNGLIESEGIKMLKYTITERKIDNSYFQAQEQILTTLLKQVDSGYTAARLQIMLRHTQACLPDTRTSKCTVTVS